MASEIKSPGLAPATTYYAVVRNAAGQYWNGSAFEAYNATNWAAYAVGAATPNSAGDWTGNFPAAAAGLYQVQLRTRAGASPAVGDTLAAGPGDMAWDGAAEAFYTPAAAAAAVWGFSLGGAPNTAAEYQLQIYANAYDAAEGVGILYNDLTEDNAGIRRFTAAALALTPDAGGGGDSIEVEGNTIHVSG